MTNDTQPAGEMQPLWTVEDDIEATIKPCPKCGGKAVLEGTWNDEIVCSECGLWSGEDMDSLEEAIEWWNKQPLIERLAAERATLQQENARLAAELAVRADEVVRLRAALAALRAESEARQRLVDIHGRRMLAAEAELAALQAEARWEPLPLGMQVNDLVRMVDGAPDKDDAWLLWGHISEPNPKATLLPADVRLCRLVPGQDTPAQDAGQRVMATMTPEIKATIETALIESRETRGAMTNEQWGWWRKQCDAALTYIQQQQDAQQPVAPDALAAHWPTLDGVPEGEDRFSQYPVTGSDE